MWMKEARGTFARMVVVWLVLVGAVGSAHAQCPHCNPASAHSLEMCRIGNPPQEFYRSGQGGVSVGSMLAQACSLYAAEHSSQAYAAV